MNQIIDRLLLLSTDSIIRVSHREHLRYPDWIKRPLYPVIEKMGPSTYDITDVEAWFIPAQMDRKHVRGTDVLSYLLRTRTIVNCLGLRDLKAIQKKGAPFFRKHFGKNAVCGWKGLAYGPFDRLEVPCLELTVDGKDIIQTWCTINDPGNHIFGALRFKDRRRV